MPLKEIIQLKDSDQYNGKFLAKDYELVANSYWLFSQNRKCLRQTINSPIRPTAQIKNRSQFEKKHKVKYSA